MAGLFNVSASEGKTRNKLHVCDVATRGRCNLSVLSSQAASRRVIRNSADSLADCSCGGGSRASRCARLLLKWHANDR